MIFSRKSPKLNRTARRRAPRKKSSGLVFVVGLALFAAIAYGIYWAIFNLDVFSISEIEINGVSSADKLVVYEKLESEVKGEPFFRINPARLNDTFVEELPTYKIVETRYTFPNKISIDLEERTGEYKVAASNGVFDIDSEGFVLSVNSFRDINIDSVIDVVYDQTLKVGETVRDSTLDTALQYSNLEQTVKIEDDEIAIELSEGGKVILPKGDPTEQVDQIFTLLQNIIQKYTIENRDVDLIDLRFTKPIIKYKE